MAHAGREGAPWASRELARRPQGLPCPAVRHHQRVAQPGLAVRARPCLCRHVSGTRSPGAAGQPACSPCAGTVSQPSPAHQAPDPEVLGSGRARQRPRCHAGTAPFISQGWRKEGDPRALCTKAVLWPHARCQEDAAGRHTGRESSPQGPAGLSGCPDVAPAHPQHLVRVRDAAGRALPGPRGPRAQRCGSLQVWGRMDARPHSREARRKGRALLSWALSAQGGDRPLSLATVVRRELEGDELIKSH